MLFLIIKYKYTLFLKFYVYFKATFFHTVAETYSLLVTQTKGFQQGKKKIHKINKK